MAMAKVPTAIAVELRLLLNIRTAKPISCGTQVTPLAKHTYAISADGEGCGGHHLTNCYSDLNYLSLSFLVFMRGNMSASEALPCSVAVIGWTPTAAGEFPALKTAFSSVEPTNFLDAPE
jgi:hypothetical protein